MAEKAVPFVVGMLHKPKKSNRRPASKPRPPRFTLSDAFSALRHPVGELETDFDIERGLRAVAFLMHERTDGGNSDLDGQVTAVLSKIIEDYAEEISKRRARASRN